MSARRATAPTIPTLTDTDVESLRQRLGAGESPRVVVRAASTAVPEGTRGTVVRIGDPAQDEYVVVRIGRDEVPFGPGELSMPGAKPIALPKLTPKAAPKKPASTTPATPVSRFPVKAAPQRTSKRVTPSPLTVTLKFLNGEWTAEATRGARRLAKSTVVRPGAVSALAEHLDDEPLREALVETVEACRAVVEDRAAALRAELADAEAALRDYNPKARR